MNLLRLWDASAVVEFEIGHRSPPLPLTKLHLLVLCRRPWKVPVLCRAEGRSRGEVSRLHGELLSPVCRKVAHLPERQGGGANGFQVLVGTSPLCAVPQLPEVPRERLCWWRAGGWCVGGLQEVLFLGRGKAVLVLECLPNYS